MDKKPSITVGTIIRTAVLAVALINQVLSASGHAVLPITNEELETLFSTAFTIIVSLIAWWKNNSFTHAAIKADRVMRAQRYTDREDKRLNHFDGEENGK